MLLDIIESYIHLNKEEKEIIEDGNKTKKTTETIIFPRYHQLDVVRKLLNDVRENGSGKNYLIQHSAGSGKSNSIAWLTHELANIHDKENKNIFTSVIVVTDRRVLNDQLQSTISGFEHTNGLIEKIGDGVASKKLKDAINDGKKIIITTLQRFPIIYEEIESNKGRRFAIIVDEAHSSQTGNSAIKLKGALADTEEALKEYADLEGKAEEEILDSEDKLIKELLEHGKHKNLSYFAFTATPKSKTLEMFGEKHLDGSFRPYHIYSMKQAIEEGFILDVLKNYTTIKTCYKLAKNIEDNPKLPKAKATKVVKRFASLHSYNIQEKTAVMIENFRETTKNQINGKAKAMVVTASRLHAIRYYQEFKRYIEREEYKDINVLIAFSGEVSDNEKTYTEEGMNKRADGTTIKESQLKSDFHSDRFNILIVAEKYQTGFDEPLLHTMFVDKKLSSVKAVQTLSRLNRTCRGKENTFVLDFVNTAEEIKESFKPYYESTILDQEVNVNLIYDTNNILRSFELYNPIDVEKFVKIFYKSGKQTDSDLGKMVSLLKPIVDKYLALDRDKRGDFKKTLRNFCRWYSYIVQIVRMFDKDLQKEYVFSAYLNKLIPNEASQDIDLESKLKLEFYSLEEKFRGDIVLNPTSEDETIKNIKEINVGNKKEDKDEHLENIINSVNDRFEGAFTESDRVIVENIYKKCMLNEKDLSEYAKNNNSEMFYKRFLS